MDKSRGFTMFELVLVIVLIGIIGAMSSRPLIQGFYLYTTGKDINIIDWQANYALEHMTREIRSIAKPTNITIATASQLRFVNSTNTTLTYNITSGTLMEGANSLASNATGLVFTYFDRTGAVTATLANIRFIRIALTLSKSGYTYTYTTSVFIPSLT